MQIFRFILFFREQQIQLKWQQLIDLLEKKRKTLNGFSDLLSMFREIESISSEMKDVEVCSTDYAYIN